jgi:hypothetical protein
VQGANLPRPRRDFGSTTIDMRRGQPLLAGTSVQISSEGGTKTGLNRVENLSATNTEIPQEVQPR